MIDVTTRQREKPTRVSADSSWMPHLLVTRLPEINFLRTDGLIDLQDRPIMASLRQCTGTIQSYDPLPQSQPHLGWALYDVVRPSWIFTAHFWDLTEAVDSK